MGSASHATANSKGVVFAIQAVTAAFAKNKRKPDLRLHKPRKRPAVRPLRSSRKRLARASIEAEAQHEAALCAELEQEARGLAARLVSQKTSH
jgi:hypothetical protein